MKRRARFLWARLFEGVASLRQRRGLRGLGRSGSGRAGPKGVRGILAVTGADDAGAGWWGSEDSLGGGGFVSAAG